MRIVLAATAVAAALAAVPASAATGPVCHARLANAATGASNYCDTGIVGSTNDQTLWPVRVVTVEVATGAVLAELHCFDRWRSQTDSDAVVAGEVAVFSAPDLETCRLTLTATADGTTATATSSPSKGFNPY